MKKRVNGAWVDCYYGYYNENAVDSILNNCSVSITEPHPDIDESGVGRVNFDALRAVETGYKLREAGLIYVKDVSITTPLTYENIGKDGIAKNSMGTGSGTKIYHLTDPNGKGARAVAYAVATDGTYVVRIYSQEARATYQQLKDEEEQGIVVSHLYSGPPNVLFTPKVEKVRVNGEWV